MPIRSGLRRGKRNSRIDNKTKLLWVQRLISNGDATTEWGVGTQEGRTTSMARDL